MSRGLLFDSSGNPITVPETMRSSTCIARRPVSAPLSDGDTEHHPGQRLLLRRARDRDCIPGGHLRDGGGKWADALCRGDRRHRHRDLAAPAAPERAVCVRRGQRGREHHADQRDRKRGCGHRREWELGRAIERPRWARGARGGCWCRWTSRSPGRTRAGGSGRSPGSGRAGGGARTCGRTRGCRTGWPRGASGREWHARARRADRACWPLNGERRIHRMHHWHHLRWTRARVWRELAMGDDGYRGTSRQVHRGHDSRHRARFGAGHMDHANASAFRAHTTSQGSGFNSSNASDRPAAGPSTSSSATAHAVFTGLTNGASYDFGCWVFVAASTTFPTGNFCDTSVLCF